MPFNIIGYGPNYTDIYVPGKGSVRIRGQRELEGLRTPNGIFWRGM